MASTIASAKWRVGLIGAGRIVERVHLPLLGEWPGVELVGLYDPDWARAAELAHRFNVPSVCRNLSDLWAARPDVTLVACPNHLHAEMSISALEAGSHVVCEKPMAACVSEAEAMLAAAQASGRELMIAFSNRFRPEVGALYEAIQSGRLGDIKALRCGWLRHKGVPGVSTWFTKRAQAGGGVLMDLGSHLLDLAIWLTGRRKLLNVGCVLDRSLAPRVQAEWYQSPQMPLLGGCDVEVSASAFAIFDGPLDIFVEASWACSLPQDQTYLHVHGNRGAASLKTLFGFSPNGERPSHPLQIWLEQEKTPQRMAGAADLLQPYRLQWAYFFDSLRAGRSLRATLDDSLAVMRLIAAMYRAADALEVSAPVPTGLVAN